MWILKAQRKEIFVEDLSKEFDNPELLLQSDLINQIYYFLVYVRLKISLVDCQVEYEWIEEVPENNNY